MSRSGTNSKREPANSTQVRMASFRALRRVSADGGYANLVIADVLRETGLVDRDAAALTDSVSTACRLRGTLDRIIVAAAGRELTTLQPAVIDVLRLGTTALWQGVPPYAAVSETVKLAKSAIGDRVGGLVNAVMRRVAARTIAEWLDELTEGVSQIEALAIRHAHPQWVVEVFAELLPEHELEAALSANNVAPVPTLAVRPGLTDRDALLARAGGEATPYSPFGVIRPGNPADVPEVRTGLAGVQDEGSQLTALAAVRAAELEPVAGEWLDACAGPGGKAALLTGLAIERGRKLLANEIQPHRARLVTQALRGYPAEAYLVMSADARDTPWREHSFALTVVDAPCSGLGALRRRPESRWRRTPESVTELAALQRELCEAAVRSTAPGGVIAWITCSPHPAETAQIVWEAASDFGVRILDAPALLPEVPDCAASTDAKFVQLWPHRHHTDAMFLALMQAPQI